MKILIIFLLSLSIYAQDTCLWIGKSGALWDNKTSWSNKTIPSSKSIVIIPYNSFVKITKNSLSNKVFIYSSCISLSGGNLTTNSISFYSSKEIKSTLLDNFGILVSSNIKWIDTIYYPGYYYYSSPSSECTIPFYRSYIWSEPNSKDNWNLGWIRQYSINTLLGYNIKISNITPFICSGNFNTGDIQIPLSFSIGLDSLNRRGWNLVPNPYPSYINWDDRNIIKTNIGNAIYIWNESTQNYSSYINGIGINGGSKWIKPNEAFFVKCLYEGIGLIKFTNSCRYGYIQGQYVKKSTTYSSFIRIGICSLDDIQDETVIVYGDHSSLYSGDEDALKMISNTIPQIYTTNDVNYSINSTNLNNVILCIKILNPGWYKLKFNTFEKFRLVDLNRNDTISNPLEYYFYETKIFNKRFKILIGEEIETLTSNKAVLINQPIPNIKIYDYLGKEIILNKQLNSDLYIKKLNSSNKEIIIKIR